MIVQTDEKGKALIVQVSDLALKYSGVQALRQVQALLGAIRPLPPEPKKPDKPKKKGKDDG